jgi:release factor glutamine methyltransferase
LGLGERVTLLAGDLTTPLPSNSQYDLIISNPPYIASKDLKQLQPEVRDKEPRLALDGGEDGLAIYRRLIPQAMQFLKHSGWLIVEIGFNQGDVVLSMFVEAGFEKLSVVTDYGQRDRVVMGMKATG